MENKVIPHQTSEKNSYSFCLIFLRFVSSVRYNIYKKTYVQHRVYSVSEKEEKKVQLGTRYTTIKRVIFFPPSLSPFHLVVFKNTPSIPLQSSLTFIHFVFLSHSRSYNTRSYAFTNFLQLHSTLLLKSKGIQFSSRTIRSITRVSIDTMFHRRMISFFFLFFFGVEIIFLEDQRPF